jgi:hypothetical protein
VNVSEIRTGLADALSTVLASVAPNRGSKLDGFPAAIIDVDTITPSSFGDDTYEIECTIRVMVSRADTPDAWHRLDELLSDDVIRDALDGCDLVQSIGSYDNVGVEIEFDDGVALGFTVAVTVLA